MNRALGGNKMLQIPRQGVPSGRTIQSRRNADFPTFPTGSSRSPDLPMRVKAPRARGARSPHTRDDVRRVVERIGAGGFEEDEEGGELPSVGAIVDARPPAAREGAAEEGEGDAPESSDDEDDGSSNRHGNDAALAFELPSDPPPSIRRQPQEGDGGRERVGTSVRGMFRFFLL